MRSEWAPASDGAAEPDGATDGALESSVVAAAVASGDVDGLPVVRLSQAAVVMDRPTNKARPALRMRICLLEAQ